MASDHPWRSPVKRYRAVRAQGGYGLIELLVSIAVGALLMVGLSPLLATFGDLADSVEQRADLQERIRLLHHMWGLALNGAGYMGCLTEPHAIDSLLNISWADLGLLRPWPAAQIVEDPVNSPLFSGINNLAPESHGLVIRGFAKPLAELIEQPVDGRGEAELQGPAARINSGDIVLLGDCARAVIFSATQTRHTSGHVRFSWAGGDGALDNREMKQSVDSVPGEGGYSVTPAAFDTGARLYAPTGMRLYVAESSISTPERKIFALWQKPVFGNALELVSGVERLTLRYGAWRGGDEGNQSSLMGYFDAPHLPQDARVVVLLVNLYLASHLSASQPRWMPVQFALPLTSAPFS